MCIEDIEKHGIDAMVVGPARRTADGTWEVLIDKTWTEVALKDAALICLSLTTNIMLRALLKK